MATPSNSNLRMTMDMWTHRGLHPDVRKYILDKATSQLLASNKQRSWQTTNFYGFQKHCTNVIDSLYEGIMNGSLAERPIFQEATMEAWIEEGKWVSTPEEFLEHKSCHQSAMLKRSIGLLEEVFRATDFCLAKDLVLIDSDEDYGHVWGPKGFADVAIRGLDLAIIKPNDDICGDISLPRDVLEKDIAEGRTEWDLNRTDCPELLGTAVVGLCHLLSAIANLHCNCILRPQLELEATRQFMEREAVLAFVVANLTNDDFKFLSNRIQSSLDVLSSTDSSKQNPDKMKAILSELAMENE